MVVMTISVLCEIERRQSRLGLEKEAESLTDHATKAGLVAALSLCVGSLGSENLIQWCA